MFIVEYFNKATEKVVKSLTYQTPTSIPRSGDLVYLDGIYYIVGNSIWIYYSDDTVRVVINVHKEI